MGTQKTWTLQIKAIDLENRQVKQWPELGVKTKFGKAATTFLLDIPDLLDAAQAWDKRVREKLPAEAMWYANVTGAGARHVEEVMEQSRAGGLEGGIAERDALGVRDDGRDLRNS